MIRLHGMLILQGIWRGSKEIKYPRWLLRYLATKAPRHQDYRIIPRCSYVQGSPFRVTFLSLTLLVGFFRFSFNPEPLNPWTVTVFLIGGTLKLMRKVRYSIYIHLLFGSLCLGGWIVTDVEQLSLYVEQFIRPQLLNVTNTLGDCACWNYQLKRRLENLWPTTSPG